MLRGIAAHFFMSIISKPLLTKYIPLEHIETNHNNWRNFHKLKWSSHFYKIHAVLQNAAITSNNVILLVLFVRLFGLCLFGFVNFLFLLGSGKSCGLWLWHSLDFSVTFFCMKQYPSFISTKTQPYIFSIVGLRFLQAAGIEKPN